MDKIHRIALLLSVFLIATCGLLYELLISSISSYLMGSSIYHFSITIGLFMFFMGVGSYLSKLIKKNILETFIGVEIILSIIGGLSAITLHWALAFTKNYEFVAALLIAIIGSLIGMEIPLIARLLENKRSLKDTLAEILSVDYIGALIASILFPIFLLPHFGTMRTSFIISFINILVALLGIALFHRQLKKPTFFILISFTVIIFQVIGFSYSFSIVSWLENQMYQDQIIYSEQSPYQRVILTKYNTDVRLFLNGHLQFSSKDEYRYHEVITHVPILYLNKVENVLVLGGGDGLATKELLKYNNIKKIDVVDLDKAVTDLARNNFNLTQLNKGAFSNSKVNIINQDAFNYVRNNTSIKYDLIIADLPDPSDVSLGKLYSESFYKLIKKNLGTEGVFITQSTSPFFAPLTFWCIHQTLKKQFNNVKAMHCNVPSFGEWGFNMASNNSFNDTVANQRLKTEIDFLKLRFLNQYNFLSLYAIDSDFKEVQTEVAVLDKLTCVDYYNEELHRWH